MRPKQIISVIYSLAILCFAVVSTKAAMVPEIMSYMNGTNSFAGYLYKPEGKGPFPVMVWNHGHGKHLLHATSASQYEDLARLYVDDGYILFVPDRHMHDVTPADYSADLQKLLQKDPNPKDLKDRKYREYLTVNANDVHAAVEWIRSQSYADKDRIFLSGWGSGAAAALMVLETDSEIRACVAISPSVFNWKDNNPLQKSLRHAVQAAKAPIFLIQPRNDVTLEPMEVLGKIVEKKGGFNRTKVYSFDGKPDAQITSLAMAGWDKWGNDVLVYFDEIIKATRKP